MPAPLMLTTMAFKPGPPAPPPAALVGLSDLSAVRYYQTLVGGGELGVATGFFTAALVHIVDTTSLAGAGRMVTVKGMQTGGHEIYITPTGGIMAGMFDGAGASKIQTSRSMAPSDAGKIHLLLMQHDGVSERSWIDRLTGPAMAAVGYTPGPAAAQALGFSAGYPCVRMSILALLTARGIPTEAQILSLFDITRRKGDLPTPAEWPVYVPGEDADFAALAPRHWYDADFCTANGANLSELLNRGWAGGQFLMKNGTLALPIPTPGFNGQPTIRFTGSQAMIHSLPPSAFTFLHDGSGFDAITVWEPTIDTSARVIWATIGSVAGSSQGTQLLQSGVTANIQINNETVSVTSGATPAGAALNVPTYTELFYGLNAAPKWGVYERETLQLSGAGQTPSVLPPVSTLHLGAQPNGAAPAYMRLGRLALFDRVLSESDREIARNCIRTRYGIHTPVAITHRYSVRDAISVSLPREEPVELLGAAAFNAANFLTSANGQGIRGNPAGFTVRCVASLSLLTGIEYIANTAIATGANKGWAIFRNGTGLQIGLGDGTSRTITKVLTAPDLHYPRVIHFVMDAAGVASLYLDGVFAGATAAGVYVDAGPTIPMMIGALSTTAVYPAVNAAVFALAGGDYVLSAAEVAADVAIWQAGGLLSVLPGDLHHYDLKQDVIANGGPTKGLPVEVRDRVGNDHLTRRGEWRVVDGGLSGFDIAKWAQTVGVALPGVATGFYAESLSDFHGGPGTQTLFCSGSFGFGTGWAMMYYSGWARFLLKHAGGTHEGLGGQPPVGRHHFALTFDGSIARSYLDGVLINTSPALSGYVPSASPAQLGTNLNGATNAGPCDPSAVRGAAYGEFVPSNAEIATAAAAALSSGKIVGVPGKHTHRYSVVDDIAEAGGKVPQLLKERVSGAEFMRIVGGPLQAFAFTLKPPAPSVLVDTVTALAIDEMRATGLASLTKIDRSIDWRKRYGALGFGTHARFETQPGKGIRGGPGASWLAWYGRIDTLLNASASFLAGNAYASASATGTMLTATGTNYTNLIFRSYTPTLGVTSSAYTPVATDVGVPLLFVAVRTVSGVLRLYAKRAQVGVDSAFAPYAESPKPMCVGAAFDGTSPAINSSFFGLAGGDGYELTPSEIFRLFDDVEREGRIQEVPDKTLHLWDPTRDIAENGGPQNGIPAQIKDRIGTDHLMHVGAPKVTTLGNVRGASDMHDGCNYAGVSGGSITGITSGFVVEWFGRIDAINVANALARVLVNCKSGGLTGYEVILTSGLVYCRFSVYNGSAGMSASYLLDPVLDKGRGIHFACVHDAGQIARLYRDGVLVASNGAIALAPASVMTVGAGASVAIPSDHTELTHTGVAGSHTVPSAAAIATAAAASLAAGKLVPIVGASWHYDLSQAVIDAGDTLPIRVPNRAGSGELVLAGAPLQVARRIDHLWGWEAA